MSRPYHGGASVKSRVAADQRKLWVQLLAAAQPPGPFGEVEIADFRMAMRGAAAAAFPSGAASDLKLAEAFLACGTAFAMAVGDRQARCAVPLRHLAVVLDEALQSLRQQEADRSWGRYGDRD